MLQSLSLVIGVVRLAHSFSLCLLLLQTSHYELIVEGLVSELIVEGLVSVQGLDSYMADFEIVGQNCKAIDTRLLWQILG